MPFYVADIKFIAISHDLQTYCKENEGDLQKIQSVL